jgi:chromosome segregation ATPase
MMYRVLPAAVATLLIVLPLQAQQPFSSSVPSDGESSEPEVTARASSDQETPREIERAQHYRLALDEFLVLVPLRLQDDIQADIDESRRDETRAKEEKRKAEDLERLARDQLDAQKEEIDAIKARLKIAKNEDREADVAVLESDKKLAEGAKKLLERRREMRRKEIDGWDTVARLAAATRKAAEFELELANARDQLRTRGPQETGDGFNRLERRVNEFEKRTLEAQKERAELRTKVAQKEKDVVNSRLELLKTRSKIESGG